MPNLNEKLILNPQKSNSNSSITCVAANSQMINFDSIENDEEIMDHQIIDIDDNNEYESESESEYVLMQL